MSEEEYVKIHLFDLKFLLGKASIYIRDLTNEEYSMKLWKDRIEDIKVKCNFDELMREMGSNYDYEVRYLKDVLLKLYQNQSEISLRKVRKLLVKENGVPTFDLPVKTDVYWMTSQMIRDGEISGEIVYKDGIEIFQRKD